MPSLSLSLDQLVWRARAAYKLLPKPRFCCVRGDKDCKNGDVHPCIHGVLPEYTNCHKNDAPLTGSGRPGTLYNAQMRPVLLVKNA